MEEQSAKPAHAAQVQFSHATETDADPRPPPPAGQNKRKMDETELDDEGHDGRAAKRGKRDKSKFRQRTFQHGSKNSGRKKKDLGRREYFEQNIDKRQRNEDQQARRQELTDAGAAQPKYIQHAFSKEEIDADDRKPKRKVAVLIGYSGTGYKGMQISPTVKSIEGDLFAAFVKAGAISKANADDPKKSSLVRCARTDKGVHAAGNVISLKLIIEDPDIVQKINEALPSQIRVWAIERTTGSFSCYQACDSRWYEYLIPTHSFLPPHPTSYIGQRLSKVASEMDDLEGYEERQKDVLDYWAKMDEEYIKPILETLDRETRELVEKALFRESASADDIEALEGADDEGIDENDANGERPPRDASREKSKRPREAEPEDSAPQELVTKTRRVDRESSSENQLRPSEPPSVEHTTGNNAGADSSKGSVEQDPPIPETDPAGDIAGPADASVLSVVAAADADFIPLEENCSSSELIQARRSKNEAVDAAIKLLRAAYIKAKNAYRISPSRRQRVADAFNKYTATHNFHNYTVRKSPKDPSAKRHIKSFNVSEPMIINDTEWLSLKVHGQSFMMHQIRKMVGMATLVVRCGAPLERMDESFKEDTFYIPKAPAQGLLLERPVFDNYNAKAIEQFEREPLDFAKYEKEIEDFKRREIYDQIFKVEEKDNVFHSFFSQIDNFGAPDFLWVTSKGIAACGSEPRLASGRAEPSRKEKKKWAQKNQRRFIWDKKEDGGEKKPDPEAEAEGVNVVEAPKAT